MSPAKQPPRAPEDGPCSVRRLPDGRLAVEVTQDAKSSVIVLSDFNAWRVFGLLAFMLGISLPAKLSKEIKLG